MKQKFKIPRKHRYFSSKIIGITLLVSICMIGVGYATWSTDLEINGVVTGAYEEPALEVEVVPNGDRLSANTEFNAGLFNVDVFHFVGDSYDGKNTVVTSISNAYKTWITSSTTVTFNFSIKNNSGRQYTNGNVVVSEYDPDGRITPNSQSLSLTTVASGETTTLTAEVKFDAKNDLTIGSYIQFDISYDVDGVKRYYHYKVLVVEE